MLSASTVFLVLVAWHCLFSLLGIFCLDVRFEIAALAVFPRHEHFMVKTDKSVHNEVLRLEAIKNELLKQQLELFTETVEEP